MLVKTALGGDTAPSMKRRKEPVPQAVMLSSVRPPDAPWAFRLYVSESGRNDLNKWDAGLSEVGRARRSSSMKFLRTEPPQRWDRPHASSLGHNVYVIRFRDQTNFQHRLFGYFDHPNHAFVICVSGFEKDSAYHPDDYVERVDACRLAATVDPRKRTVACTWPIA